MLRADDFEWNVECFNFVDSDAWNGLSLGHVERAQTLKTILGDCNWIHLYCYYDKVHFRLGSAISLAKKPADFSS